MLRLLNPMALVCAALLVAGSCGEREATSGTPDDSRPTWVAAGWRQLDSPLAPRSAPAVVAVDEEFFIFGGATPEGRKVSPHNDGGFYDPALDKWRTIAPAPFSPPLMSPGASPVGSQVLVVGVPCEDRSEPEAEHPECYPAGLAAALYDPVTDTWRAVSPPPAAAAAVPGALGPPATPLASGGVFLIEDEIWTYEVVSDSWRRLVLSPSAMTTCWTRGGAAFGIELEYTVNGARVDPPPSPTPELVTNAALVRWLTDGHEDARVELCTENGAALAAPSDRVYIFDVERGWTTSEPAPAEYDPAVLAPLGDSLLVWGRSGIGTALDLASGRWRTVPAGPLDGTATGMAAFLLLSLYRAEDLEASGFFLFSFAPAGDDMVPFPVARLADSAAG
jgi:hypothetical protein